MDGCVHGTYVEKVSKVSPESLSQHILDTWFNIQLFDPDINGKEKFLSILEDESIGQSALAHTIKSHQNQGNDLIVEIHQVEHEREENNQAEDEGDHNRLAAGHGK